MIVALTHLRTAVPTAVCAVAAVVTLLAGCGGPPPGAEAPPPTDVTVVAVKQADVAISVATVGTVVPLDVSRVATRGSGPVISFPLREGAYVEAGDVLARLEVSTIQIALDAANALLTQREQELARLEAGYRPEEIAQAEARMLAAEAVFRRATADLERKQLLHEQRTITDEELDEAQFMTAESESLYVEAQAQHEMHVAGNREEDIAIAEAALAAQQHAVAELEEEIAKRTIVAPYAGYLVEKHTDVGEWVSEGGPVATLVRLDEVEVEVSVDERYIDQIRVGQEVDVFFDALGPDPERGTIGAIVPRANWQQGSRSFPVIVRLRNETIDGQPRLKEGMLARITFRGRPHEALLAHKDAIVRASGRPIVYVVDESGTVRGVEVREGVSEGVFIEVFGELAAGELLVTEGAERVRPFDEVNVLNSASGDTTQLATEDPPLSHASGNSGGL